MMWHRLAVMAFAFVVCLQAATPCSADPPVPFGDAGTGVVTHLNQPDPSVLRFVQKYSLTSEASDTGLGSLAMIEGSQTLTFEVGSPLVVGASGTVTDGLITYTTVDGATLTGTYSGSFVRVSPNFVLLSFDIHFGSGTGRLRGINGSAQMMVRAIGPRPGDAFTYTTVGTLRGQTSDLP
jgi:hypothetical protein